MILKYKNSGWVEEKMLQAICPFFYKARDKVGSNEPDSKPSEHPLEVDESAKIACDRRKVAKKIQKQIVNIDSSCQKCALAPQGRVSISPDECKYKVLDYFTNPTSFNML